MIIAIIKKAASSQVYWHFLQPFAQEFGRNFCKDFAKRWVIGVIRGLYIPTRTESLKIFVIFRICTFQWYIVSHDFFLSSLVEGFLKAPYFVDHNLWYSNSDSLPNYNFKRTSLLTSMISVAAFLAHRCFWNTMNFHYWD